MVGRGFPWLVGRVVETRSETSTSRTIVFDVPGWVGHLAGQHVDVRLTAEDGYSTQRSYSIATPSDGQRVALTIQRVPAGEVSPYLVEEIVVGDEVELRGPIGGWFVWRPDESGRVLLVAGGSGVVPLMAMVRERSRTRSTAPFTLIYSVRSPREVYYADELSRCAAETVDVSVLYTRSAPAGAERAPGRISSDDLARHSWPPGPGGRTYVCGPTAFVEAVVGLLLEQGHDPATIRTERFGPTGG